MHAGLKISPRRLANAYASLEHTGGWDGEREHLDDVEVRPLTPDLADEYLAFFDGAFSDNPAWASCYCLSYESSLPPIEWEERTGEENRAEKGERIRAGESSGVVALANGRMVGWCHAAPRTALPALDRVPGFESDDPFRAGAIICFVVPPQHRGQGLAKKLLDGACDMLRDRGFAQLDVYPPQQQFTAASGYHGSKKMYEDAGFTHVRDAGRYVVMRKAL